MTKLDQQPAILALGTAVPQYCVPQQEIGQWMAASFHGQPVIQRLVRSIHAYSGIDARHSCTPEYLVPATESPLAPGQSLDKTLTTAERMAIYERESIPLGMAAAMEALTAYATQSSLPYETLLASITHLLVVSCTGFFAPGLDFMLATQLKLPATIKRTLIGFMGCAASFNALRAATEIVQGDPQARVLIVSVELCSLHSQQGTDRDLLVAASLFSDGASACLVGLPDAEQGDYFTLDTFHTSMKPDTQEEMVWQIGDYGFALRLSSRIPQHLADVAPDALVTLFGAEGPAFWAIHPGGRAIVDRLAEIFMLPEDATESSREILRRYGNMSSATILFVLQALQMQLRQKPSDPQTLAGVAMAFGPGLVIEMARLEYVPRHTMVESGISQTQSFTAVRSNGRVPVLVQEATTS